MKDLILALMANSSWLTTKAIRQLVWDSNTRHAPTFQAMGECLEGLASRGLVESKKYNNGRQWRLVEPSKPGPTVSLQEAKAILAVEGGADVYDYGLAKQLRGMQRRGVEGLFEIGKAQMAPEDGAKRQPYFGCIATKSGLILARAIVAKGAV